MTLVTAFKPFGGASVNDSLDAERLRIESYLWFWIHDVLARCHGVKPKLIEPKVKAPLVSIVADNNFVVLSFVRTEKDPKDPAKTDTTTWFDMFRIEKDRIAEHWDGATK